MERKAKPKSIGERRKNMSAGAFTNSKYQAKGGTIHPIRVQPETITAFNNAAPAGATTSDISAVGSLTRRQRGLRPRYITVKFTGTLPEGYKEGTLLKLPILTPAVFDGLNVGGTGNYLGAAVQIISKEDERAR